MNFDENSSLGHYLRSEREKKNITLEQVAYATRISTKMLRALEEDNHKILPAAPFVRGYLQSYAKYVDLDMQDVLLRYQHHLATLPIAESGESPGNYIYARERKHEKKILFAGLSLAVLLAIGAGAVLLVNKLGNKTEVAKTDSAPVLKKELLKQEGGEKEEGSSTGKIARLKKTIENALTDKKKDVTPQKPEEAAAQAKKEKQAEAEAVATATTENPPATTNTAESEKPEQSTDDTSEGNLQKKYNLALTASEDAWFRFQQDDGEIKDIMLRKGRTVTLRGDKVIKLFSGNLGAIQAKLNGKPLETMTQKDRTMSAVIPFSEVPNYPLPLFPPEALNNTSNQPENSQ